ncbi:MAG: glycosyltransferase [Anaerolineae bacterium]|nr:glycosyltransferase [Anaerolineae bacterium]
MMPTLLQIIPALLLLGLLLLNLVVADRADRYFRRLSVPREGQLPTSSAAIIVPARNEAANIGRCASSLVAQKYPCFSVTIVDDDSSDATAEIAANVGASVLPLRGLPPTGWTGKCNACDQAAQRSDADWLLFTDADTYHQPNALRNAIAYAEQHKLDALSLLLHQECGTFAERIVLPLAYQNLFAALPSDHPTFNGQFILIRRQVYQNSGGFGSVRGRVMEDVALADGLCRQGYKIALANGEALASVRMYRDSRALWQGMTKTTFTAAKDRGWAGFALALLIFCNACLLPLALIAAVISAPWLLVLSLLNVLAVALGLSNWLRRFGVPAYYALLNPIGTIFLWLVGVVATARAVFRLGVRWKDRTIRE